MTDITVNEAGKTDEAFCDPEDDHSQQIFLGMSAFQMLPQEDNSEDDQCDMKMQKSFVKGMPQRCIGLQYYGNKGDGGLKTMSILSTFNAKASTYNQPSDEHLAAMESALYGGPPSFGASAKACNGKNTRHTFIVNIDYFGKGVCQSLEHNNATKPPMHEIEIIE